MLFQEGQGSSSSGSAHRGGGVVLSDTSPKLQVSVGKAPLAYPGCNFYPPEFIETLDNAIQTAITEHTAGSLLLVSITNLSMIINAYGHDTSEVVVHDLMGMIKQVLNEGDIVERLQRDQIAIILINRYPEDTNIAAQRIHAIFQNFGRDSFATTSLYVIGATGSVNFPLETTSAQDALDKAYISINSSQASHHKTYETTKLEVEQCRQQMGLANYFFRAYQEKNLRLAYQPVIDTKTGGVAHYEALLRIITASGKISSAGALIPVAERMGLMDLIDTMVLDMVLVELRRSQDVHLAMNVSNLTTEDPVWLDHITQELKNDPEVASRLTIEITETATQRDLRRTAFFVASLQSLGCSVSLDDFGSGYTSFRQLQALSVDSVKIDGAFIKDLAHNSDNRFFVKTLLDFTQGFGLQTVAEFVETGEVAKILMEMGVDQMQGYYFAKPQNHRSWLNEGEYSKD
ncbi:MAG: GGDEF domain-containing protein [Alphaproteobacteria bacterium]|nr:GGDEF domain-containing protein [Alphaproteobacteria bacterium]